MVEEQLRRRDVTDERVLEAMRRVPRHLFVPEEYRAESWGDFPLPIGFRQTISQPYIVGIMAELLGLGEGGGAGASGGGGEKVLEIGGGCGYQAAVLGLLAAEVHTVEIVAPLAQEAAERLVRLGFSNVRVHIGDGRFGWPEAAPYDGILLAAAPLRVPQALFDQLRPGRRLVAPVGPINDQVLMTYEKDEKGNLRERKIFEVRFVPLIGAETGAAESASQSSEDENQDR